MSKCKSHPITSIKDLTLRSPLFHLIHATSSHCDPRTEADGKVRKTTGLYWLFPPPLSNQSDSVMNGAPSQQPHPLFS